MILVYDHWFPDIRCPECGTDFTVERTYEDCLCDCDGHIFCLECDKELLIVSKVVFSLEEEDE